MASASTAYSSGNSKVRPDRTSAPVTRYSVVCISSADTIVAKVKLMTSTSITFSRRAYAPVPRTAMAMTAAMTVAHAPPTSGNSRPSPWPAPPMMPAAPKMPGMYPSMMIHSGQATGPTLPGSRFSARR